MTRRQPPRLIRATHGEHFWPELMHLDPDAPRMAAVSRQEPEPPAPVPAVRKPPPRLATAAKPAATPKPASAKKPAPVRRGKLPSGVDPLTVPLDVALAMINDRRTPRSPK